MRFAAIGRTQWLYDAILACVAEGHVPAFIVTASAAPEYLRRDQDFLDLGQRLGCPVAVAAGKGWQDILHLLHRAPADIAISVNWPVLIPAQVREAFRHGIINAHAGDLPRYRGNACPNWAIINGEKQVCATIHRMDDGLDSGDILGQERMALDDSVYIGAVYDFLGVAFPRLFARVLGEVQDGSGRSRPQPSDPASSLRCFPRRPEDGAIDWALPADALGRLVRASAEPFAGAFASLLGRRLVVWRARPETLPYPWLGIPGQVAVRHTEDGSVSVLCGRDVLRVQTVELDGGGRLPAADVLRSTRERLGPGGALGA